MATQSTALNAGTNESAMIENRRKLISMSDKTMPFYNFFGENPHREAGKFYITDYQLASAISREEMAGVATEGDVTQQTSVPTQVYNWIQNYVAEAQVEFSADGNAVPGGLGNITKQEQDLLVRAMGLVDRMGYSQQASRKRAGATASRAGTPGTFLGKRLANGNTDTLANQTNIISVAASADTVLTDAGGYNDSTTLSVAINDATDDANRGHIELEHLIQAQARIFKALDSAEIKKMTKGTSREGTAIALVDVDSYNRMMQATTSGIMSQNRFTTKSTQMVRVGGKLTAIQAHVTYISSAYGTLCIKPYTGALHETANRFQHFAYVWKGDATEILYKNPPMTEVLKALKVNKQAVVRSAFTYRAPHAGSGVVIVGNIGEQANAA